MLRAPPDNRRGFFSSHEIYMHSCNDSEFCGTVISHVMMPYHANPAGNVNGGVIMQLIDDAAFVIASRFARSNVVTASIDRINFHRPVHVGDLLTLKGCLNMTHRSSMEIGVRVEGEDMRTGKVRHIASAYLTFVALDKSHKPTPLSEYIPTAGETKRRHREALQRRVQRHLQSTKKNHATRNSTMDLPIPLIREP